MNLLKDIFKTYQTFTKSGIVLFVLVVGLCGYVLGVPIGRGVDLTYVFTFLFGLYALSSGSLALNQVQEVSIDKKMERTQKRPLVENSLSVYQASVISIFLIFMGLCALALVNYRAGLAGLATIVLYNGVYTYFWKKMWAFGAVPGALPGAMPPVIGYLSHPGTSLTDPALFYLFGVLFLWQMPHFWILAIKYKEDYRKAGIPVLPAVVGDNTTVFHMGLYLFSYLGLAVMAPLYIFPGRVGTFIIWGFALLVFIMFLRYLKNHKKWLLFFLSLNLSILIFSLVPALSVLRYYI